MSCLRSPARVARFGLAAVLSYLLPAQPPSPAARPSAALPPAALPPAALFWQEGLLVAQAVRVPSSNPAQRIEAAVRALLAGPLVRTATSALPPRIELEHVVGHRAGSSATVTVSDRILALLTGNTPLGSSSEAAFEQLYKTILRAGPVTSCDVRVSGAGEHRLLRDLVREAEGEPPTAQAANLRTQQRAPRTASATVNGALSGKRIVLSPGHGFYWHTTLGWTTQRPNIGGLIEDIHNNEIAMRYVIPYLENMGAEVISCRERGEVPVERIGDNDLGAPGYRETGGWTTSQSAGWQNRTYRFATTTATETATATWAVPVARDGRHPVYVYLRASSNRATDALYRVQHSGGTTEVTLDQTRDDRRWRHLGTFHFDAQQGARVTLSNRSVRSIGRVVIADAVRVGAGSGSINRGGGVSGKPKWQEAARYWTQYAGAPPSVYNSSSGAQDNSDDVTARPRYAEWRGADAFVSMHTNAGSGPTPARGTSSFIYNGTPTAGSSALQRAIHTQFVGDMRRDYDPTWVDRGQQRANFGELRVLRTMPGVLLELAFHDRDRSPDHNAIHDPDFRRIAGRAIARGILRYFNSSVAFPPEPPEAFRLTGDGSGGLRAAWDPVPGATQYVVEVSAPPGTDPLHSGRSGQGFVAAATVSGASWSTGALPADAVRSIRIRARNATGQSLPTDVLTAGTSPTGRSELLLVQGFDRLEKTVKTPENTKNYLGLHADAIRRNAVFALGFDAATNEAILRGRLTLGRYRAVDWACGEESTVDSTFDPTEQALLRAYAQSGGRLLVSGAEIGWDLEARGNASDRAFHRTVLGARYVADDAGTYSFRANPGALFDGLGSGAFSRDTSTGAYDVDFPDVLAAADNSSRVALLYGTGGQGAAIQRTAGNARVVYLGFPLETILDPDLRAAVMRRSLRFLLDARPLQAPASVAVGQALPIRIEMPAEPGAPYLLGASLGRGRIVLPGGELPLAFDGVFSASLQQPSPVFAGFLGVLDANGRAAARFQVPPLPFLRGFRFWFAGVTLTTAPAVRTQLPWLRAVIR